MTPQLNKKLPRNGRFWQHWPGKQVKVIRTGTKMVPLSGGYRSCFDSSPKICNAKVFAMTNQAAGRTNTDHYIDLHEFSSKSKTLHHFSLLLGKSMVWDQHICDLPSKIKTHSLPLGHHTESLAKHFQFELWISCLITSDFSCMHSQVEQKFSQRMFLLTSISVGPLFLEVKSKSGTDYLAGKGLQRPRDSLGINLGDLRHVVIAVISIQVGQRLVLLNPAPTDVHKGNGDPQRNGREDGGSDGCCDADVWIRVIQRQQEHHDGDAGVLNPRLDGNRQDLLPGHAEDESDQPAQDEAQVGQ